MSGQLQVERRRDPDAGFTSVLIAPCGINCRVCRAYLREKNPCHGCRSKQADKPKTRSMCKIKLCVLRQQYRFCFECASFPCDRLRHLDERYRTKYHCSVVENLSCIKSVGIQRFLRQEKNRWRCQCGGIISVHSYKCSSCGKDRGESQKKINNFTLSATK